MKKSRGSENALTVREIAAYSLGALGREVSANAVNAFFLVFLCIYMHLNPLYMTIAFVIAKLWDAVNDPMLAALVNNSKSGRLGRYRPWILFGGIANAVCVMLMFMPVSAPNEFLKYLYYISMYVLWGMSYTVLDVPSWSMMPTIADTTDERNKLSSFAKLVGGFGGFTMGTIGTSFILPHFSAQGMEKAYSMIGIAAAVLMVTFVLIMLVGNKEKYKIPNERVSLRIIKNMLKSNDQLRAYIGSYVFYNMGSSIAMTQILYLYVFCYENAADYFDSTYSYTFFWIIACTGQGIAMMFYSLLTKKIPREKIYSSTFFMAIFSYVFMFSVFFFLNPGESSHLLNTVLVGASGACLMLANGMQSIGSTVMIADVVDYGEWKNGVRGDSVIFSVQTLLGKFAGAAATLVLGIGISAAGLPNVREAFDPQTNTAVQQFVDSAGNIVDAAAMINGGSLTVLRVFMFLIPIPLCIASCIIYRKKYRLYGEKYDAVKREIDLRRVKADEEMSAR